MVRLIPASSRSALFLLPSPHSPTILTQDRFIAEFHQALHAAGISNALSFRGHWFRPGAASCALNHSVPGELYSYTETGQVMRKGLFRIYRCINAIAFAHQLHFAVLSVTS